MMKEILINIAGAIILFAVAIGIVIFVSVILYPLIDHWQKGFEAYLNTNRFTKDKNKREMKEFEVNGVQYMAVELPESARHIEIDGHVLMYDVFEYGRPAFKCKVLPVGVWQVVEAEFAQQVRDTHNLNDNSLIIKKI